MAKLTALPRAFLAVELGETRRFELVHVVRGPSALAAAGRSRRPTTQSSTRLKGSIILLHGLVDFVVELDGPLWSTDSIR